MSASSSVGYDDHDFYEPEVNEMMISQHLGESTPKKYFVKEILGNGGYGTVLSCNDEQSKTSVAIKVATHQGCKRAALDELHILRKIKSHRDGEESCLIQLLDWFEHKGRLCIVMEQMEMSLEHFLVEADKEGKYLALAEIRCIIKDVLVGLAHLKEMGIVHTDIKPDNIMLRGCGEMGGLEAKIIDFGWAHYVKEQDYQPSVQMLRYRSPEVIMSYLPYSEKIDVWSVGCIMGELLTGLQLYPGKCEYDQLRYIIQNQGLPPEKMIENGKRSPLFFEIEKRTENFKFKSPADFLSTVGYDDPKKLLYERYGPYKLKEISSVSMSRGLKGVDLMTESTNRQEASHLIQALLKLDPHERISAREAMQHPFFQLTHSQPYTSSEWVRNSFDEVMEIPIEPKIYLTKHGNEAEAKNSTKIYTKKTKRNNRNQKATTKNQTKIRARKIGNLTYRWFKLNRARCFD